MSDHFEAEWVHRAMSGDGAALSELWRRNRSWLCTVILGHRPPDTEVEDLLQEVALRMVADIGGLRRPEAFRGWCRQIAVNISRSARRRSKVQRRHLQSLGAELVEQAEHACLQQGRDEAARQDLQQVMDLLEGLHPDYREPLLLKSLHGWSQRKIAETLGVPETTVETRLVRARRMLRQKLQTEPSSLGDTSSLGDR